MKAPVSRLVERALRSDGFDVMIGTCNFPHRLQHWHSGLEISLIHSGVAEVFVGGSSTTLLPGDAVIHSAEIEHGSRGEFSRTVIHFVADMVPHEYRTFASDIAASRECHAFEPNPHATRRFLWAAHQLALVAGDSGSNRTAKALLGLMLADILHTLEQEDAGLSTEPLRDILSYMHMHTDGTETVDSVAARFGISRSHLAELFAERIGTSPGAYWLKVRLEHACTLLVQRHTVREVADAVGFQSVRGFQRAFQRVFRMTPSEYRALASQNQPTLW